MSALGRCVWRFGAVCPASFALRISASLPPRWRRDTTVRAPSYFEIWNEPNISEFWSPAPDPAAYTADLKAAYTAIKAVTPSAMVITAGLAPAADSSNTMDTVTFVQDMYADGAQGYFDGIGDHPYTYPFAPDNALLGSAWSEMDADQPVAAQPHDRARRLAKKIWITEYGAPTSGTDKQRQL